MLPLPFKAPTSFADASVFEAKPKVLFLFLEGREAEEELVAVGRNP